MERSIWSEVVSWTAVFLLALGYWMQVVKIHIHKEVRDLSIAYCILLLIGFAILGVKAYIEKSELFLVKQIMTFIPVSITVAQIIYHRKDKWQDSKLPNCVGCSQPVEKTWQVCPYCGIKWSS